MTQTYPSYLNLLKSGELTRRVEQAQALLGDECHVCPVRCGADRARDEQGECGVGRNALMASFGPHFGEEPVLVGRHGSGTVFFAGCNLHCVYCQNHSISQLRQGAREVSATELAQTFLHVQSMGCHNLNLVTPSHVVPQILEALWLAAENGLSLPIVYNTSSYDSFDSLRLLDGVVDVYMPDSKYSDASFGERYSGVKSYPRVARRMLREMHRQTGDLVTDSRGLARSGLLIRHLVLPNDLAGSRKSIDFIVEKLSPDSYVNVMDQYRPAHRAQEYPELMASPGAAWWEVVEYAASKGIHRGIPFDRLGLRLGGNVRTEDKR